MRAYRVSHVTGDHPARVYYAGSQAEASALRNRLVEECCVKRSQTVAEEVEIPTDKAGLLAFLNAL